jgi:hypothetical protein
MWQKDQFVLSKKSWEPLFFPFLFFYLFSITHMVMQIIVLLYGYADNELVRTI